MKFRSAPKGKLVLKMLQKMGNAVKRSLMAGLAQRTRHFRGGGVSSHCVEGDLG